MKSGVSLCEVSQYEVLRWSSYTFRSRKPRQVGLSREQIISNGWNKRSLACVCL